MRLFNTQGNILVAADSTPVLLDFGLTKRFEPQMKVAFAKLIYSSYIQDLDALARAFEEMGLKIAKEAQDPIRDMGNMSRLFSTTAVSKVKERRLERAKEMEAKKKEELGNPKPKVNKPLEAWPSELVFFLRVTGLLKGLCSSFDIEFPYLEVMAKTAVHTVKDDVPKELHAQTLFHPEDQDRMDGGDVELQKKLEKIVSEKHKQGEVLGLQLCCMHKNKVVANIAAGTMSLFDPRPVQQNTLFNVFSVTKAFLACAVHLLIAKGSIKSLEDKVSDYWPEFASNGKEDITVRQLVSHESGLAGAMPTDGGFNSMLDWEKMLDFVAEQKPGNVGSFEYHAISYAWTVGGLIEKAAGMKLKSFIQKEILEPSDISDVCIGVNMSDNSVNTRLASIANPQQLRESGAKTNSGGSVFRSNPTLFNMAKVREAVIPSANSHMTAAAIAKFYSNLFLQGEGLLSGEIKNTILNQTIAAASSNVTENQSFKRQHGLGFQIFTFRRKDKKKETVPVIGHLGFGGAVGMVIDAGGENQVSVGITTNMLDFDMESSTSAMLVKEVASHFGLEPQTST